MKKYKKDYEMIFKRQANGKVKEEVEYIGNYYISQLSIKELRKRKIYYLALSLCSIIILTIIGILDTPGSRIFYVALPYSCLFLPSVFSLIGTIRFLFVGEKIEFIDYDKTRNRVRKSTIGIIMISLLIVIGDVFFILSKQPIEKHQVELLFLTGVFLILVLNILFFKIQKQEIFKIEEPVQ